MNTDTDNTALILAGDGYQLTIAPEAEARKAELLRHAFTVLDVSSNDDSAAAQRVSRSLAAMRIEVEKCRKAVKEPVNRIGKLIDATATNFIESLTEEEKRINKLVGAHAENVARLQREKEAAERKAFDEALAAREALADADTIANVIAATKARAARMAASDDLAATKIADGVRFAWDFEVICIESVFRAEPDFVTLEIKRAAVLSWLKSLEDADDDATGKAANIGIRAFKKPVVSSR